LEGDLDDRLLKLLIVEHF
jgi:hypothetical protein